MRILAFALVIYSSCGRRVQGPSEQIHEAAREKHQKPQRAKATATVLHGFNQATGLGSHVAESSAGVNRRADAPVMRASSAAVKALTGLILHQEPDWIAVAKPPGVPMEEGEGNLLGQLNRMFRSSLTHVQSLDTETSGVVLVAKNHIGAEKLHWHLSEPSTVKTFRAILRGVPYNRVGTWTESLTKKAEGRKNPRGLSKNRMPAQTEYRVMGVNETSRLSLAEITLTGVGGPKHQVRKHAAVKGHQIAGDRRYGDPKHANHMERVYGSDGMMLHLESMRIRVEGVEHEFKAPYPPSWNSVLETIPLSRKFRPKLPKRKKKVVLEVELGKEKATAEDELSEVDDEEEEFAEEMDEGEEAEEESQEATWTW
mmetsp:Transcript_76628/g.139345  ORF Transcript_76628/g.139345 Transcript_76628/m.139345 type:complete len:370 (+) Transcript_76628:86-1195(+)